jgi:predicted lactoylglutathione lyase
MSGWGRKVWIIIIIKLFIIIVILKIFFFQDFLNKNFKNEKEKSEHVLNQLTNSADNHD